MNYLRQSTTVTVQMGPFLDKTDGVTAETALSPTVQVSKAGAVFAARSSATAITHDADGFYRVELDATDTATVGRLLVKSFVAADAVPVWHEFVVIPQADYDALVAGTGTFDASLSASERNSVADAVLDRSITEPTAIFTWSASLRTIIAWLGVLSRNKITQTDTTQTVRNDADSATIATSTHSEASGTYTRGEFS